jgi:hypothetical protein
MAKLRPGPYDATSLEAMLRRQRDAGPAPRLSIHPTHIVVSEQWRLPCKCPRGSLVMMGGNGWPTCAQCGATLERV